MFIVILMKVTYLDREFNFTPFGSSRISILALLCSIIGLQVSNISSHFRFNETVIIDSIVSTCNNLTLGAVRIFPIL